MRRWIIGGIIIAAGLVGMIGYKGVSSAEQSFSKDQSAFLKRIVKKTSEMTGEPVSGARVFLRKSKDGILEIARLYHRNSDGQWIETTMTRVIPEATVPYDLLAKLAYSEETDITDVLEMQFEAAEGKE